MQEYTQDRFTCIPSYQVVGEKGPDHDKRFNIEITVRNKVEGVGNGRSKKEAEQNATMATRRLAKRQITWLRSLKDHNSYDILENNLIHKIHDLICQEFKL